MRENGADNVVSEPWWLPDRIVSTSLNIKSYTFLFQKSDLLRREYFRQRKRSPIQDLAILVVLSSEDEIISVGRPLTWPAGVAEAVQKGESNVHSLCFTLETMPAYLQSVEPEKPILYSMDLCYGDFADSGCRTYMEDKHITEMDLLKWKKVESDAQVSERNGNVQEGLAFPSCEFENREELAKEISLFAVFDGHRGDEASALAQAAFPRLFAQYLWHHAFGVQKIDLTKPLKNSLEHLEKLTLASAADEQWDSGTTAVICAIYRNDLVLGNIGDSRAVLSMSGKAVELTKDQNLKVTEEVRRVLRLGGRVCDGYLNDQLSVSRALGDLDLHNREKIRGLSAEPTISTFRLGSEDEFVIIACDGLWDVFLSQHAITFVRLSLMRHGDPRISAQELVEEAIKRGSTDNVTAIVVSFHKRGNFRWKEQELEDKAAQRTLLLPHVDTPPTRRKQRPRINFSAFSREAQQTLLQAAHGQM